MNSNISTASATAHRAARRPLRIVVADDDSDFVMTLITLLEDEGHVVQGVEKGDEVMRLVRRMNPQVVILDIAMPGQSGFAIAQDIRAAYYDSKKPLLIAISGHYKKPADRMLSQLVGFDHHLVKPCNPDDLIALL